MEGGREDEEREEGRDGDGVRETEGDGGRKREGGRKKALHDRHSDTRSLQMISFVRTQLFVVWSCLQFVYLSFSG